MRGAAEPSPFRAERELTYHGFTVAERLCPGVPIEGINKNQLVLATSIYRFPAGTGTRVFRFETFETIVK